MLRGVKKKDPQMFFSPSNNIGIFRITKKFDEMVSIITKNFLNVYPLRGNFEIRLGPVPFNFTSTFFEHYR